MVCQILSRHDERRDSVDIHLLQNRSRQVYKLYYVEVKSSLCCKKRIQGYHIMHSTNIGVFRCEANDVCSIHRQWTGLKRPSFGCLIPAATGKKAPSTCNLHNTLVRRLLVLADLTAQWILARNEYIPGSHSSMGRMLAIRTATCICMVCVYLYAELHCPLEIWNVKEPFFDNAKCHIPNQGISTFIIAKHGRVGIIVLHMYDNVVHVHQTDICQVTLMYMEAIGDAQIMAIVGFINGLGT